MLIGRGPELSALLAVLADARASGGALAVVGAAGVGKTALLAEARRAAAGFTVATARGLETEAELPFGGLADVVRPLLGALDDLPAPQRDALAGALALAPPSPGDRFAVCTALCRLAELGADVGRPLLVVVDDLHWLDAPSRECIEYLARRPPPGVAVLVALRDDQPEAPPPGSPVLSLEGLDDASASALLANRAPDLDPGVAAELAAAAAGNPLALLELPAMLSAEQRAGRAALPRPLVPGRSIHRAFAGRIRALPDSARTALLAVATAGGGDLAPIARALATLGVAVEDLEHAEAAQLLTIAEDRVAFAHPLVAAVAYHAAAPATRRRVHAALAAALGRENGVWHLAAAAAGPSPEAAEALERVAADAAARRAHATAAAALERAARLSGDDAARAQRLIGAGGAALVAGRGAQARALLAEASAVASSAPLRLQAEYLRGHAEIFGGDVVMAGEILAAAAEGLATGDTVMAARALADASLAAAATGDCRQALQRAQRAAALLGDGGDTAARAHVLGLLSWGLVMRGRTAEEARPVLAEAERLAAAVDPHSPVALTLMMALNTRVATEGYAHARRRALAMLEALRAAGSMTAQVTPLVVASDCAQRLGLWDAGRAEIDEAIEVAEATGQLGPLSHALSVRARLDAATGRDGPARAAIAQALAIAAPAGIGSIVLYCHAALGLLELGLSRVDAALAALREVERLSELAGFAVPTLVPWAPDLVETLVRAGRRDDAVRAQQRLAAQARAIGTPGAAALAERCAGIVARDAGDEHFAAALAHHAQSPVVFEHGRTLLAHGARLHRARRRAEARRQLHAALDVFERLGADPWANLTRAELHAAGGRLRQSGTGLTSAELRVATAVARGVTNRQVAAELFLSPKTVEFHLRNVYRKLGVRSRTQLALALPSYRATPGALDPRPPTDHPVAS